MDAVSEDWADRTRGVYNLALRPVTPAEFSTMQDEAIKAQAWFRKAMEELTVLRRRSTEPSYSILDLRDERRPVRGPRPDYGAA